MDRLRELAILLSIAVNGLTLVLAGYVYSNRAEISEWALPEVCSECRRFEQEEADLEEFRNWHLPESTDDIPMPEPESL